MDAFEMVREFHRATGAHMPEEPTLAVAPEIRELRLRLISEELDELRVALASDDLTGTADALADLLYVTYGTALTFGIPIDDVFAEVHRANLAKFDAPARSLERGDRKVPKPPGWEPPDVAGVLRTHESRRQRHSSE